MGGPEMKPQNREEDFAGINWRRKLTRKEQKIEHENFTETAEIATFSYEVASE